MTRWLCSSALVATACAGGRRRVLAFGIGDAYGLCEPGKVANVVVWSGDPFETSTAVEHLFIQGRELALVNRQTELRDRYKVLPARY